MIDSKPRHGEPIFEKFGDRVVAAAPFQRWIDDVTDAINGLEQRIEALEQRIEALESP